MANRICITCNRPLVKLEQVRFPIGGQSMVGFGIQSDAAGFSSYRSVGRSLKLDVYQCPVCSRVEFYRSETDVSTPGSPKRTCPKCGTRHDSDCSRCPLCGWEY